MPLSAIFKSKKVPEAPVAPSRDWEGLAQRLEKRVQGLESSLQQALSESREKDKRLSEKAAAVDTLQKRLEQEKNWRDKEESSQQKEKKQGRELQEELATTRAALDGALTARIRLEYEFKELRQAREDLGARARELSSRVLDLERQLEAVTRESAQLKQDNTRLNKKKEAEQWVTVDDYRRVTGLLKRANRELDRFKARSKPAAPAVAAEPAKVSNPVDVVAQDQPSQQKES